MERGEQQLTRSGSGCSDRPAHGHTPGGRGRVVCHLGLTLGAGGRVLNHPGRGGGGRADWEPGDPANVKIVKVKVIS